MGTYFFVGVTIYLLILATLLVWFLKYHNNDPGSKPTKGAPDFNGGDGKDDSPLKPNQMSADLIQAGAQSGSEKREVLPGYCSQPKF